MPLSPTSIPTAKDRRYFIESCKIFTVYATLTDITFSLVSYCKKYRWNYSTGIFKDRVCVLHRRNISVDKSIKYCSDRVPNIRIDVVENHHHKSHYEGIINIRHNRERVSSMHLRSHNKRNTGMRY
jgi:hypothetical protein